MKSIFDYFLAIILITFLLIPIIIIGFAIKVSSRGNVFHWSKRVGKNNIIFLMPKYRTMVMNTPDVATHLLDNPDSFYTPMGRILRRSSLDELPQLFSVLRGHMSFVGPRPALYNQSDLIQLRTKIGIHKVKPGITGWAQVNGRDEILIPEKVALDEEYLKNKSWRMDLYILWLTLIKVIIRDDITH